jgi:hypothetical protein
LGLNRRLADRAINDFARTLNTIFLGNAGTYPGAQQCLAWRHGSTLGSLLHSRFGALTAYPDCRRGGLGSVIDREPPGIWELPVDLDFVASVLEGDPIRSQGAFLDLTTGEVIYSSMIDYVAKDAAGTINVATEPDRWLFLPSLGSRAMLPHMAEFVAMITYRPLQDRMERAIEGLGAFHGFGDLISSEGLIGTHSPMIGALRGRGSFLLIWVYGYQRPEQSYTSSKIS